MTVSYLFVVCFIVVVCSVDALQVRNSLFLKSRRVQTSSHTVSTTPWHSPLSVTHHHYYTKLRDNQSPVDVSEVVPAHLGGKWRKYDIPNKLTAIRVLCIPLFIAAFTANKYDWTFWTFIVASVTDFVDGYLARKWQQTTPFGAFLDPVADKLMVSTAMILLCTRYPTVIYTVPIALILCREIAISALREWMGTRGIRDVVQVGKLGKIKTTLQMIAMVFLLLVQVLPTKTTIFGSNALLQSLCSRPSMFTFGMAILYLSTAATIWSGAEYLIAAWPTLTKEQQ